MKVDDVKHVFVLAFVMSVLFAMACLGMPWYTPDGTLPVREMLLLGLGSIPAFIGWRRQRCLFLAGTSPFALLFLVLVIVSGGRAPNSATVVTETVQTALYFLILPVIVSLFPTVDGLNWGLAVGMLGTAGVALLEPIQGLGIHGAGILDNRFVYGASWAALLPLVVPFLWDRLALRPRMRLAIVAGIMALAGWLVTSPPLAFLVGGAVVVALARSRSREARRFLLVLVWLCLATIGLFFFHRGEAVAGIGMHDADGTPRRWVQECVAAGRALRDAPFFGHGVDRFQETVSSGLYRRELPRPAETKVERGMESGLLVHAVENGIPAAIMLLAVCCMAFLRTRRKRANSETASVAGNAAAGLLFLGAAAFFTPIDTRAAGPLFGVLLGLAIRPYDDRGWPAPLAWFRHLLPQAVLCLVVLGTTLVARRALAGRTAEGGRKHALDGKALTVVMEAEQGDALAADVRVETDPHASAGKFIDFPEGAMKQTPTGSLVRYTFDMPRPAKVFLWFRVRWEDGCGNSVAVGLDGATPYLIGNDGTYRTWHWIRGGEATLDVGSHTLVISRREDGIAVDQILLVTDKAYVPAGILDDRGCTRPTLGSTGTKDADLVSEAPHRRTAPFRLGFGGCYRGGFEAACIAMGLPWGKVEDVDLTRPERLADFQVICLSEPRLGKPPTPMFLALESYVKSGGTLMLENISVSIPARFAGELFPSRNVRRLQSRMDGVLQTDDSVWFRGVEPGTRITMAKDVHVMTVPGAIDSHWQGFGKLFCRGKAVGPAIFERRLGKGRILFSSVSFSFHTMWRNADLLPSLESVLTELVNGRCTGIAPMASAKVPDMPADVFADDFMRAGPGLGPAWRNEGPGTAICTGEKGPLPHTEFSLMLEGEGRVAAASVQADPEWSVSAAVHVASGEGGLWLALHRGEIRVGVDDKGSLSLVRRLPDKTWVMARKTLSIRKGWQRYSLVRTPRAWVVFVCGQPACRVAESRQERPTGDFGVWCREGKVFFDDVRGRPGSCLVPGTDRCRGEDGSPQAWGGLDHKGIEKRTVYSLPWLSRPSSHFDNALRLVLPNFVEGSFFLDGQLVASVPADSDPALVAIADPAKARQSMGFVCSGWHDYVFHDRLTDWYGVGADWIPRARWSCDPRWFWLGAESSQQTGLWYKRELTPPYAILAVVSVGASHHFREEYRRGRDLNLTLGGNGEELTSGMSVRIMSAEKGGVQIWRENSMLQQIEHRGLPSGHSLHHNWFEIRAIVLPDRLSIGFEGKNVLDLPLQKPVGPGYIALWTQRNSIRVARVTLSVQDTKLLPGH